MPKEETLVKYKSDLRDNVCEIKPEEWHHCDKCETGRQLVIPVSI